MTAHPQSATKFIRVLIVLFAIVLVCFVLWCTPLPDPYFLSCERPCNELDWPMICRFKLVLEDYQTMTGACGGCPQNTSACFSRQCVLGDGTISRIFTANRMFPGPTLQVCENDIILVDVVNKIQGSSLGIHWGGQDQKEFPFMDGVPGLTQCAVPARATFQYKFRATKAGTHLWSATGIDDSGTLSGALIVHQSPNRDVHRHLYDFGEADILVTLNVWNGKILVNGRPSPVTGNPAGIPCETIKMASGSRRRMRILHSGGDPTGSPLNVSVDQHVLQLIALDGSPVEPKNITSLLLSPGERADVVLDLNQLPGKYGIRVSHDVDKSEIHNGGALLVYEKAPPESRFRSSPPKPEPTNSVHDGAGALTKLRDVNCVDEMPLPLHAPRIDNTIYLPFDFKQCNRLFNPSQLSGRTLVPLDLSQHLPGSPEAASEMTCAPWPSPVPRINNITFTFGLAPPLTQLEDALAENVLCRGAETADMAANVAAAGDGCQCLHVIDIPFGEPVELVLVDQGGSEANHHVFNLHGNRAYVVGDSWWNRGPASADELRVLDETGELLERRLDKPPLKDTFSVPPGGVLAVRFIADNPGYWLLHDQNAYSRQHALAVVLHVGSDSDLPSVPEIFPKCANFIGPEFFLM